MRNSELKGGTPAPVPLRSKCRVGDGRVGDGSLPYFLKSNSSGGAELRKLIRNAEFGIRN